MRKMRVENVVPHLKGGIVCYDFSQGDCSLARQMGGLHTEPQQGAVLLQGQLGCVQDLLDS